MVSKTKQQLQMFQVTISKASDLRIGVTHNKALVQGLVDEWHSVLKHPQGWRVAFLLSGEYSIVGVATLGRPVARHEDQVTTLELTRMALADYAPKNSATYFMGQMRRWIRRNMPEIKRLISYQDEDAHLGTIYRADNWILVYSGRATGKSSWNNREGRRIKSERKMKSKWERMI